MLKCPVRGRDLKRGGGVMHKKLPIGIENFKEMHDEDFYYVDKTGLITELMNDWSKVNLFTRPRRFGKTLNMSMLRYFFEVGTDKSIFDGLKVSEDKELCEKYMGKYPVVFVTLKGVDGLDFESAYQRLRSLIRNEASRLSVLRDSALVDETAKSSYLRIIHGEDTVEDITGGLSLFCQLLEQHYGQKAVLLIDEYDVPLDKAYNHGFYDQMIDLIRSMFGAALKTNDSLFLAVLTGCMRISKESIFTGLNNLRVHTISDAKFNEYFGFTDDEVKDMLKCYGLESHYQETKEWYDGYRFGGQDVYCPWDVINYLYDLRASEDADPKAFWSNTSGNDLLRRLIDKADAMTKSEIERLVAGETVEKDINQELTYREIEDSIENIWSVLYTTGYLTMAGKTNRGTYMLRIPNEELRIVYRKQIIEWINKSIRRDADTDKLKDFWKALVAGDAKSVETYINNMLGRSISILDPKGDDLKRENSYHMIVMALLAANAGWVTRSNIEAGDGFADLIVETDNIDAGIVIELKYVRDIKDMEAASATALKQIKDKHYYEYLYNEGREDVMLCGMAFCKKRCRVVSERLQPER